jgi:quercetin dioxygenase-like cupin family protein
MQKTIKSYDKIEFDFNDLTKLLSSDNWVSTHVGNWLNHRALQSCFVIDGVHTQKVFHNVLEKIIMDNNLNGRRVNVHLFVGFSQGATGAIHKDDYNIYLYGLCGETMYIVEGQKYILGKGDFLKVNKGELHQAIGVTPRMILSIAEMPVISFAVSACILRTSDASIARVSLIILVKLLLSCT